MDKLFGFVMAHKTAFALLLAPAGWTFSALMGTMPPLKPDAGYWATWAYKFAQAVGANFNKQHEPQK